jgi:hypothetical protein
VQHKLSDLIHAAPLDRIAFLVAEFKLPPSCLHLETLLSKSNLSDAILLSIIDNPYKINFLPAEDRYPELFGNLLRRSFDRTIDFLCSHLGQPFMKCLQEKIENGLYLGGTTLNPFGPSRILTNALLRGCVSLPDFKAHFTLLHEELPIDLPILKKLVDFFPNLIDFFRESSRRCHVGPVEVIRVLHERTPFTVEEVVASLDFAAPLFDISPTLYFFLHRLQFSEDDRDRVESAIWSSTVSRPRKVQK